jgi:hypothetical protein
MNTIIKKIEKKKLVSDGYENKSVYITKDGQEFEKKQEALKHEEKLIDKENFSKKYYLQFIELDNCYNAIFIKELNDITKKELYQHYWNLNINDLGLGWNLIYVDDSGDHTYSYCYSLANMIKQREEEILRLKELESKIKC